MAEQSLSAARRGPGWWLDRVVEWGVIGAFLGFVALSFTQVVLRYGFGRPLTWSEEISRYLFVWVVFVGAGVAARHGSHIVLDFLVARLPAGIRRWVGVIMTALCFGMLLLIFVWQGWILTTVSMRQDSPATGLPVGYATLAIPVGGLLTAINLVRAAWERPAKGGVP
jgi:TRAP-type C4-dicarboxylate transport system permease small subunit